MKRRPRKALINALEARYGRHSDKLIEQLEKIAFGKRIEVETDLPGVVKVLSPTISEMREACLDLLAYQHGRPSQNVDVEVSDTREKWNPDKLSMVELQQIDALARKAQALPSGLTVDTTFKLEKPE